MYKNNMTIISLMLEAIDKIHKYSRKYRNAGEFFHDEEMFDATLMNFITLGEMVSRLSEEFKTKYNYIEWRDIYDFRNIIAHDYFGINAEEVWDIIQNDLPKFKQQLSKIRDLH